MCGIVAVVRLDDSPDALFSDCNWRQEMEQCLHTSLCRISYRGPDNRGSWISKNDQVALGHVRLAINDESLNGQQPFHDSEHDLHVIVNGEIYNHEEIRKEFTSTYTFRGTSDCEVVIPLYVRYGKSFLSRLRGEFCVCLYDGRQQLFLAARDRHGVLPLFWTITAGHLWVASEEKAFPALGCKPKFDIRSMFEEGWLYDARTFYTKIKKIRPGRYLTCLSGGHIEHFTWWDTDFPDKRKPDPRTETEMSHRLRELLIESIKIRLPRQGDIAVMLSGGIDSSIIAGVVKHLLEYSALRAPTRSLTECLQQPSPQPQNLILFTIGFDSSNFSDGARYDEVEVAERTAQWLGVKHVVIRVTQQMIADNFRHAVYCLGRPDPDMGFVARFVLFKAIHEMGIKVVIGGAGADDSMGGYRAFLPDFLQEVDHTWSTGTVTSETSLRISVESVAASIQRSFDGFGYINTSFDARARCMIGGAYISSLSWTNTTSRFPWKAWVKERYRSLNIEQTRVNGLDAKTMEAMQNKWHPLHTALYLWRTTVLPETELRPLNDLGMSWSVEVRTPYLDHRLIEFIDSLPPNAKLRKNRETSSVQQKHILKKACKEFITDEVCQREKFPFSAPAMPTKNGPIMDMLQQHVTKENVERLGYLDWDPELLACAPEDSEATRILEVIAALVVLERSNYHSETV